MSRLTLALVSSFSMVSLAGPREDAVAQALERVQDAREDADDATGACKRALKDLGPLSDKLSALKKDATDKGLTRARELAEDVSEAAKEDCQGSLAKRVRKALDKAVAQLERAQAIKGGAAPAQNTATTQKGSNVLVSLAGGIGSLFAGASSNTSTNKTETRSTRRTEEINGQPIDGDDEAPAPSKKKAEAPSRSGFQATCQHNSDCDSNTCFVGRGNLGYCTKMCSSWSECPSHWECKRAANAPQSICMQDD